MTHSATVADGKRFTATVADNAYNATLKGTINITIAAGGHYDGATVITPGNEMQTLETAGLVLDNDITINPIPSNYGLVMWDGSVLTVS